ncbi:MAG: ATP-binding cassette domain-containing protein [bacterium]|nr:ATP-binding cassette domain-containing protein [bacterium]
MGSLRVEKLSVAYRTSRHLVRAVSDVSFSVERGKILALWGHSGCGKSTIMKALLGLPLDDPGWVGGQAWFNGEPVSPIADNYIAHKQDGSIRKDSLGFYRQQQKLLKPLLGVSWRTVLQEPIYSFEMSRLMDVQVRNSIRHMTNNGKGRFDALLGEFSSYLEKLDLTLDYLEDRVNLQLSGGECQRIGLAMNLVGNPGLMLVDEPTTAMDNQTRQVANQIIREKVKSSGMSVLLASHNRDELLALADSIVVLCSGEVVERFDRKIMDGTDVNAFHPYTRKLWFSFDAGEISARGAGAEVGSPKKGCPFVRECPIAGADSVLREKCAAQKPELRAVSGDHEIACWALEGEQK